jgi:hypothetical protein
MGSTAPISKTLSELSPDVVAFSNAHALLAQTVTLFGVAALIVFGRCYVRAVILKAFGKDDWTMLLAMVSKTQLTLSSNRF